MIPGNRIDSPAHEIDLTRQLWDGLRGIAGVRLYGPPPDSPRVGVVGLTIAGYDPHAAAAVLDESYGIQARAGLHCAPGVHRALATLATGGTLRFSVGPLTTGDQIGDAVREMASAATG
ncbi:MAG: aminotransferase class V-fold PLP-dependent enzyme [Planctomycetaceae bacterium]|nr:aminotransferase class V-fold PLP-dependent enzyme [Planctomycetaceae bacterium]